MYPALTYAPPLALPAPEAFAARKDVCRAPFDGLIERAISDAGALLVFRVPARPGTAWREVAALAGKREGRAAVTLLALKDDGATVSIAPDDPELAVYAGLAHSWADVMTSWAAA